MPASPALPMRRPCSGQVAVAWRTYSECCRIGPQRVRRVLACVPSNDCPWWVPHDGHAPSGAPFTPPPTARDRSGVHQPRRDVVERESGGGHHRVRLRLRGRGGVRGWCRDALRRDEAPSRVSIGLVGVLAFIFVFGALFGLAAFHSVLVQNQLHLDRLSRDVQREQTRYQDLRIEYGQAAAPFRILAQASARGMLPSKSRQKLQAVLPEQGSLTPPSAHPFGAVSNFVPPVVSAPPTTTAPTTTAPATAPTTAPSAPPASTIPQATTKAGA